MMNSNYLFNWKFRWSRGAFYRRDENWYCTEFKYSSILAIGRNKPQGIQHQRSVAEWRTPQAFFSTESRRTAGTGQQRCILDQVYSYKITSSIFTVCWWKKMNLLLNDFYPLLHFKNLNWARVTCCMFFCNATSVCGFLRN